LFLADLSKHVLPSPARTQGDGMETTDNTPRKVEPFPSTVATSSRSPLDTFLHRQTPVQAGGSHPVVPGTVITLNPKYFTQTKKENLSFAGFKSKEPKFVPYEPYKASVNPIVPTPIHSRAKHKHHRNVIRTDPHVQADSSSVKSCEEGESTTSAVDSVCDNESGKEKEDEKTVAPKSWSAEKQAMEAEIKQLKDENGQMDLQLKFQAQVNFLSFCMASLTFEHCSSNLFCGT